MIVKSTGLKPDLHGKKSNKKILQNSKKKFGKGAHPTPELISVGEEHPTPAPAF